MKHRKSLILAGIICLTLIVAALPVISACAGPGEKTLKIGITTPSTGPAAEKGAPMGMPILTALNTSIQNSVVLPDIPLRRCGWTMLTMLLK